MKEIVDPKGKGIEIRDSDSLVKSGLVNSLAIVEIITFMEEKFGIDIGDHEIAIDDFDSIESMCKLLERKGAKA
jgi:acyl carrier protein